MRQWMGWKAATWVSSVCFKIGGSSRFLMASPWQAVSGPKRPIAVPSGSTTGGRSVKVPALWVIFAHTINLHPKEHSAPRWRLLKTKSAVCNVSADAPMQAAALGAG